MDRVGVRDLPGRAGDAVRWAKPQPSDPSRIHGRPNATTAPEAGRPSGIRDRLASLVHLRPVIQAVLTTWIVTTTCAFVLMSPYGSDDVTNSYLPRWIASGRRRTGAISLTAQASWVQTEGRFIPGSVLWTEIGHGVFTTRESYKFWLFLLSLGAIVAVARLAVRLTRRPELWVITALALASTWAFRTWFDGLATFAGLLPATIMFTAVVLTALVKVQPWPLLALAALLWYLVLVTYEVAIVFTPIFAVLIWVSARRLANVLALVVPSLVAGLTALVLKVTLDNPTPRWDYTMDLDPARVVPTYLRQFSAALPLSQYWYPGTAAIDVPWRLIVPALLVIGIPVLLTLMSALNSMTQLSIRPIAALGGLGLAVAVAAPILVSLTMRWQAEIPPGQGYLSVAWGYAGLALLMAAALMAARLWHVRRGGWAPVVAQWLLAGAVAAAVSLTFVSNFVISSAWTGLPSTV